MIERILSVLRWLLFWLWQRPLARLRRVEFHVDCRAGNDDSPGTETAPMRTLAELGRRVNGQTFRGDLWVQLEGSFDEVLELVDITMPEGSVCTVAGGSDGARRRHRKAVRDFHNRYMSGDLVKSADYPDPPAGVNNFSLNAVGARARFDSLRFGKRR